MAQADDRISNGRSSWHYRFLPPRLDVLLERFRDPLDDFRGTLAPFLRASLSPIAIACLRLLTLPPDPLFSVPFFRRRIADSTRFDAAFPYLAMSYPPSAGLCKRRARA